MNIFLFSMGLGPYSLQLAQALGVSDKVAIALDQQDVFHLKNEFPGFMNNICFDIVSVPHFVFPDPRKLFQVWRSLREIRLHHTDVIHISLSGAYLESYLTLWLAHKAGIPLVATLHDIRFHPGDFARFHTIRFHFLILEMCSQLIVHGQSMAAELINWLGIDERMVNIVPHGNYDIYLHAEGKNRTFEPKPGQVLFFGRMKKYKGIEVLMRAAPRIAQHVPDLKIILAGQGDELDRFETTLKANPIFEIRNRYIPAKEAVELFSSSTLVVIPYIEASQSGPLHLSYSLGRPVVATAVGAIPESMQHGREGFLVAPNDPEALAEAMIKILNSPDLSREMGRAARRKADRELNWAGEISAKTRVVYQKARELRSRKLCYPGLGAKERWKRVKQYYFRVRKDEYGRQNHFS